MSSRIPRACRTIRAGVQQLVVQLLGFGRWVRHTSRTGQRHQLARCDGLINEYKTPARAPDRAPGTHTVEFDDETAFQLVVAVAECTIEVDAIAARLAAG